MLVSVAIPTRLEDRVGIESNINCRFLGFDIELRDSFDTEHVVRTLTTLVGLFNYNFTLRWVQHQLIVNIPPEEHKHLIDELQARLRFRIAT